MSYPYGPAKVRGRGHLRLNTSLVVRGSMSACLCSLVRRACRAAVYKHTAAGGVLIFLLGLFNMVVIVDRHPVSRDTSVAEARSRSLHSALSHQRR